MTRPDKPGGQAADPEDDRPDQDAPDDSPRAARPTASPARPHEAEEVPEWR